MLTWREVYLANIIIVLILVALVGYGIYSYVHHLTHGGGCCGEHDAPAKKVEVGARPTTPILVMGVGSGMTRPELPAPCGKRAERDARHLGRRGPGRPERHHSDQGRADEDAIRQAIRDAGYLPLRTTSKV